MAEFVKFGAAIHRARGGKVKGIPANKLLNKAHTAAVTVVFHPLAERELIAAAKFYETRASGLVADFIREVERTLTEIVGNPDGISVRGKEIQASGYSEGFRSDLLTSLMWKTFR